MIVAETERLTLRRMTEEDAELVLAILLDDDFVRFVGDRGVRTLADARAYVRDGPMASYASNGFGLYLVARRDDGSPVGMCGLLRRDYLDDADVGYAFLPAARRQGFALEAVLATIAHARTDAGATRLLAIISPENIASRIVAERAGMREHGTMAAPDGHQIVLYEIALG